LGYPAWEEKFMQHRFQWRVLAGIATALLSVVGSGCGDDEPDAPSGGCEDTTLTYTSFAKPFIGSYCASCHGASVTGTSRLGAPVDDVFDTRAQVAAKADDIKEQVVVMKTMPFGNGTPKPSDADRVKLGQWLSCGAPE
jgi:uncharacterized membrane protein